MNEHMRRALKNLDCTHQRYMNEVAVDKQRRDVVLGRMSLLIQALRSVEESRRRVPATEDRAALLPPSLREATLVHSPADLDRMAAGELQLWEL
ncbi:hypothetical protein PR048_029792 [Dryococelus australis]|uniref:Uncharacterized protein n=1 Tax=Dryococelus australis TaxID=614101 RepID=A0ABQ9GB40_9NEOP|nr:hypothetical protein PR048_029792 [Dryococelus australis]